MRRALAVLMLAAFPARAACPGYSACPVVDYARALAQRPAARAIVSGVDQTEATTLRQLGGDITFQQLVALLGQALAFDKTLSANSRQACAECHWPKAGFAGGVSAFARGGGIFPGANPNRTGFRTPQSLAYAGFAPPLAYSATTGRFAGGNFWDSRATGAVTGSPTADQAAVPLTNPFEMGLPDPACAVRRVQLAQYALSFGRVWGAGTFDIAWPADVDTVCGRLNTGGADQAPVQLSPSDRAHATLTVQQIGLTISAWETSSLASPFTAKFDAVQSGTTTFTPAERRGYALFTGRAQCSACHAVGGARPLFTDFSSANIGVPRNPALPYYTETAPDADGYVANAQGAAFIDQGLGGYLSSAADTNPAWQAQAARFMGAFQVPTLRNAARPAGLALIKSYMHNGYFTDLKTVVHFLNTRDTLPRCAGATGIGVTCWPAPEQPENVQKNLTGALGLSMRDEEDLVAFLGTLSDRE